MLTALVLLAAFLLGSIPTGVLVARHKGVDLRKVGSGNIGATNVGRALGSRWAALVLIIDATKGALPVLVLGRLLADPWLAALGGMAAVLGQVFSIFLRGRGGKGVATSLGAGMALAPIATLACLGTFLVLYAVFRIVSIGSLAAWPHHLAWSSPSSWRRWSWPGTGPTSNASCAAKSTAPEGMGFQVP
jgi:glycerol-3-phosphate acyltransferase PlsY